MITYDALALRGAGCGKAARPVLRGIWGAIPISTYHIAQTKPDLSTYGQSWRNQTKATFEAAKETGRKAYFHFEGQPADAILQKIAEYAERYGVEYIIDIIPLGIK